jgi:hypothetical protein
MECKGGNHHMPTHRKRLNQEQWELKQLYENAIRIYYMNEDGLLVDKKVLL